MRLDSATRGTRGAAAAILLDGRQRVLVVKPTYKPGWGMPGGVIEESESPFAACVRELDEELGISPVLDFLVGVDWIPARLGRDPANVFVFVGRVADAQLPDIRLPADELSEHRFVETTRLPELLPEHVARRIEICLLAHRDRRTVYLEFGREAIARSPS